MAKELYILGLPGSGKSRAARFIVEILEKNHRQVIRYNDFKILKLLSEYDTDGQFKDPHPDAIFDVKQWSVFDVALKRLEQVKLQEVVNNPVVTADKGRLTIIEFSRNNYEHAFSLLKRDFLKDAYYLHLDTPVVTCKERIRNRAANPVYEDDYPVSDFIFDTYYHSDDGGNLRVILRKYSIDESQVLTLPNNGTFEEIAPQIEDFIERIFAENVLIMPESVKR